VQTDADAQRLLSDAKAIKRQAEAELARVRSETQVSLAAKLPPVVDVAASREKPAVTVAPAAAPVAAIVVDKAPQGPVTGLERFNGRWSVAVNCSKHEDGASGYRLSFAADVRDGVLRGENGTQGEPDSVLMQGDIQPDGSALLRVKGLTGDPRYAVKRAVKGTPYAYQVEAQFDGAHGSGRRLQLRACQVNFDKQ
jgi:hypothetical protein